MKTSFHFFHTVTVPPTGRKRKSTTELKQDTYTVTVAEVADDDAPVAIIEKLYSHCPPHSTDGTLQYYHTRTWRWYKEQLWVDSSLGDNSKAIAVPEEVLLTPFPTRESKQCKDNDLTPGSATMELSERVKAIDEWASRHLIVNGVPYKRMLVEQEPRYIIRPDTHRQRWQLKAVYEYLCSEAIDGHYRIDELDEVHKNLETMNGVDPWEIEWLATYEILIPKALRLDIKSDAHNQREERFWTEYKYFCHSCGRHFSNREQQIRALQHRLQELQAKVS